MPNEVQMGATWPQVVGRTDRGGGRARHQGAGNLAKTACETSLVVPLLIAVAGVGIRSASDRCSTVSPVSRTSRHDCGRINPQNHHGSSPMLRNAWGTPDSA